MQRQSSDGYIEEWHPSLFASKANAEDNPTWDEATNGPYANDFWEACKVEYDTLIKKNY
jgi:hypothetical protein